MVEQATHLAADNSVRIFWPVPVFQVTSGQAQHVEDRVTTNLLTKLAFQPIKLQLPTLPNTVCLF